MATALLVGKGNEQVREINERRNKYKKVKFKAAKNAIISHENKIYRSKHTKLDSSIKSYFKCINKQKINV